MPQIHWPRAPAQSTLALHGFEWSVRACVCVNVSGCDCVCVCVCVCVRAHTFVCARVPACPTRTHGRYK